MAINTFSHAVLSASLIGDPPIALGSGYYAAGSTAKVVSLTAGKLTYDSVGGVAPGDNPIPSPGIGTVGLNNHTLSGVLGVRRLGAIGTHPVSQLLYNPPPTAGATGGQCNDPTPNPYFAGTDLCKGYGNLNEVAGKQKIFQYELVSPEDTETYSRWRPHLHHHGSTFVASSLSGITVALRTAGAQAGRSRHQVNGHHDSGIEVEYYLGDPLGSMHGGGMVVSAGLSSDHLGFVGPEHARKRLLGF
tara:strand:+ start:131 stop:868 length:738 start_codon:yes stop_codon:yes gene_type:complete